jgi:hypothetical protein
LVDSKINYWAFMKFITNKKDKTPTKMMVMKLSPS